MRLGSHAPPVVVAVHYPNREGERRFSLIELGPSSSATYVDPSPVGVDSTIGMFADALSDQEIVQFGFEGSQASAMRFKTLIDA